MGFGEFLGGIVEAVEGGAGDVVEAGVDIAENAVGAVKNVAKAGAWAVTHVDDAAKAVGRYGGEMAQGVGWLATHPGYWDDAAKSMIIDQFTDPVNIATNIGMLGLTVATGGAAAPAWMAKVGLGAKAGVEAASGVATAAKVADTAMDVSKVARTASRMERFTAGAQKVANKIDEIQSMPTELIQRGRSAVTGKLSDVTGGLVKQRELSYLQSGRQSLATRTFGGVDELKTAEGWGGAAKRLGHRSVAGGAMKSELIGAGTFGELNWRANRIAGQTTFACDLRENMQVTADITQAVAHPERAARELGEAAWHEYGDEATRLAIKKAPGLAKKKMFKDTKDEVEDAVYDPYQQAVSEQIPLMDFRLDQTRSTRTSKRRPGQPTSVTKTTTNSTMPTQIGPENWYGPQGGYAAGRGFKREQTALPPLEQPGSFEPRSRGMVSA